MDRPEDSDPSNSTWAACCSSGPCTAHTRHRARCPCSQGTAWGTELEEKAEGHHIGSHKSQFQMQWPAQSIRAGGGAPPRQLRDCYRTDRIGLLTGLGSGFGGFGCFGDGPT